MYARGGCPSCVEGLKKLLNDDYKVFEDLPFYIVYTGSSLEVTDIKNYKKLEKLKFLKDSLGVVKSITINENKFKSLDPRLTVVKGDTIILDTTYNWKDIQSKLIPTMMNNLGF